MIILLVIDCFLFFVFVFVFVFYCLTYNVRIFFHNELTSEDGDREIIPWVAVVVTRAAVFPKAGNKSS